MRPGQYAVVDIRDPQELRNKRHEIAVVYDDFETAVRTTAAYVGQYPNRQYVIVKGIATVKINPEETIVEIETEEEQEIMSRMNGAEKLEEEYQLTPYGRSLLDQISRL